MWQTHQKPATRAHPACLGINSLLALKCQGSSHLQPCESHTLGISSAASTSLQWNLPLCTGPAQTFGHQGVSLHLTTRKNNFQFHLVELVHLVNNLTTQLSTLHLVPPTLFSHLPQRDTDFFFFFSRHFHYSLLWSFSRRFMWKNSCHQSFHKQSVHFHGWIPMQAVEQKPINFQMCRRNNCKPLKPLLKNRNASTGGIKVCQNHLSLCNIILPRSTRTKYAAACLSRWGRQCQGDRAGRTVKMRGNPSVHSRRAQRSSWHVQVMSPWAVCSSHTFRQNKKRRKCSSMQPWWCHVEQG